MPVSSRQKKLLKFFGVPVTAEMSIGGAGWEIGRLMSDKRKEELWCRYLFVTQDFGYESDELLPFDMAVLEATELPEDWDETMRVWKRRGERLEIEGWERIAAGVVAENGPYDVPQPEVVFDGKTFVFTGKFEYGERRECQTATRERGGVSDGKGTVGQFTDYLVIGSAGSPNWSSGKYGRKIEKAIVLRRDLGCPAIISEEHWVASLDLPGHATSDELHRPTR